MTQVIEAIYEDGVIKPLEKVEIRENQIITVKIVRKEESIVERTFNKVPIKKEEIKRIIEETEDEWGIY